MRNRPGLQLILGIAFCAAFVCISHALQLPGPQNSPLGPGTIGTANIADGAVTNAKVSASAAIAGSKLNFATTDATDTANIQYHNQALSITDNSGGHGNVLTFADHSNDSWLTSSGGSGFFSIHSSYISTNSDAFIIRSQDNGTTGVYVTPAGGIVVYKGVDTKGWGIPTIYGTGRTEGAVAAVASVATYTVGAADGSFIISANVNVTTSTTFSFTTTCDYTDEGNTSRTLVLSFTQVAGVPLQTITNITGAGPYEGIPVRIRAKAATAITLATAAGGTYTAVAYNVEGDIIQLK